MSDENEIPLLMRDVLEKPKTPEEEELRRKLVNFLSASYNTMLDIFKNDEVHLMEKAENGKDWIPVQAWWSDKDKKKFKRLINNSSLTLMNLMLKDTTVRIAKQARAKTGEKPVKAKIQLRRPI